MKQNVEGEKMVKRTEKKELWTLANPIMNRKTFLSLISPAKNEYEIVPSNFRYFYSISFRHLPMQSAAA